MLDRHRYIGVLARPDDDEPRLAYADAVEAPHPRHATLIREQVAYRHARIGHDIWKPGRASRMFELARALRTDLVPAGAAGLVGRGLVDRSFRVARGFIEGVTVRAGAFATLATDLVAAFPLRLLGLVDVTTEALAALAAVPELARLRGLALGRDAVGDGGVRALLTSPYLTRLRWLDLTGTGVTEAGIRTLAASGAMPDLRCVLADPALGLNAEGAYDWDGTLVYTTPTPLADRLAEEYPGEWLRRGTRDIRGYPDGGPQFDEV